MKDTKSDILTFWFDETPPQLWFQINEDFDRSVRGRFAATYDLARLGSFDDWQNDPDGALALCILYDQFPRNMFRGTARAYESDRQGIVVAKMAIAKGFDQVLQIPRRRFIYLPFQHSETLSDQKKSVTLFEKLRSDDPVSYEYAQRHFKVIERFGRFPHRNVMLSRTSTPEELAFLADVPKGY